MKKFFCRHILVMTNFLICEIFRYVKFFLPLRRVYDYQQQHIEGLSRPLEHKIPI